LQKTYCYQFRLLLIFKRFFKFILLLH